jgi:hypothetical protein
MNHLKKILITGDIMMHDLQHEYFHKLCQQTDFNIESLSTSLFDDKLMNLLRSTDCVLGNLETIIDDSIPYQGYPNFNASTLFLNVLQHIGFTDLIVTNNHSKDHTYQAWLETVQNVISVGIQPHGHKVLQFDDFKNLPELSIIAGSDRFNKDFDDLSNAELINYASQPAKMTHRNSFFKLNVLSKPAYIVYSHAGKEYSKSLSIDQFEILQQINESVDKPKAVIFTHSHVIGADFQRTKYSTLIENGGQTKEQMENSQPIELLLQEKTLKPLKKLWKK